MILVVGQHPDPHIETVCAILRQEGAAVCILDRFATDDHLSFKIASGKSRALIHAQGSTISLGEVSCVWWRVKPTAPVEFPGGGGTLAEQFRTKEWNALLRSLPAWLSDVPWINPLIGFQLPRTKPAQLMLARDVGFRIPDTVISNNVDDVTDLFGRHKQVIYKTLDSFLIPPDKIIYTNIVTKDDVLKRREEISFAPCLFQEFVEKSHELRVTVVGDEIFAIAIDSQGNDRTKIDWRRDQSRSMYVATELDETAIARLRTYMQRASLVYGAFDFVVTPEGQIVFLECNPGGQWLWLEKATNLPISRTLAGLLARKAAAVG